MLLLNCVVPYDVRDAIGQRRLGSCSREVGCAHEHLDANRTVVDLDAIQCRSGFDSLLVLVEDDGRTTEAAASRSILQKNLLWSANTYSRREVVLQVALVVMT